MLVVLFTLPEGRLCGDSKSLLFVGLELQSEVLPGEVFVSPVFTRLGTPSAHWADSARFGKSR